MATIAGCVAELQDCLKTLQATHTANLAQQAQVVAALKDLGATPANPPNASTPMQGGPPDPYGNPPFVQQSGGVVRTRGPIGGFEQ